MANRIKTWSSEILTAGDLNAEFDNIVNAGSINRTGGYWGSLDDVPLSLGTSQDVYIEWDTTQTTDCLIVGLGTGNVFSVMEKADMSTNWGIGTQTNPTLFVHSADATATTDYISLTHNQTDGVINVGGGSLLLNIAGTTEATLSSTGLNVAGFLQCDSITNDTGLAAGTYTPTASNLTNLDSVTPREAQYMRVGNTVTVSGVVDVNPTSNTTLTSFEIDLPVASNLGDVYDLAGCGSSTSSSTTSNPMQLGGDVTNNTADVTFISDGTGSSTFSFVFVYQVI